MVDFDFLGKIAHSSGLVGSSVVILRQKVPPNVSQTFCSKWCSGISFTCGGSDFPKASTDQIFYGNESTSPAVILSSMNLIFDITH